MTFTRSGITATLVAAASLATAATAAADVTVVIRATKDAMIFGQPNNTDTGNASGRGPALFAGADGGSRMKRSMLAFDVASAAIPANATILNVTMTMYLAQVAGSGGGSEGGGQDARTFRVYSLQQNWGEGPSGLPTSPNVGGTGQGFVRQLGDSSWTYAIYDGNPWTAGGALASEVGNATFASPYVLNQPYSFSSPGMLSDVNAWVSGQAANNGWLVRSDLETTPTSFLGFWSRDGADANANPALAPQLSITYSVPAAP